MILERAVSLPILPVTQRILYVPRGPLLVDWDSPDLRAQVLADLLQFARQRGALLIKIDPEVPLGIGEPGGPEEVPQPSGLALKRELTGGGWLFSADQIQYRNTILIDLSANPDDILARMKSKTRYNIRLARRRGVSVRPAAQEDFDLLYRMYAATSVRDGFVIRDQAYYQHAWQTFHRAEMAEGLIAEVDTEPVGGVMIFRFAGRAWYVYGMSLEKHREKMPNHLLQWEGMVRARSAGCEIYDLWGAPDEFNEQDPMWGVYRFKQGLGGTVVRTIGAWDYPVNPMMYRLYSGLLPKVLTVLRRQGQARTRSALE
jgi:lipid II:glycine glycyltransferase (peptidoglycan interpeptide bridge formation enzyme)